LYPEAEVADLGTSAFAQLKQETPTSSDPRVNASVDCIAKHIAAAVPEDKQPPSWEVRVFEDETPNAFALPGGKIGVHTGMLKVADNPAQLASVLGHEVGHVLARHTNERLSQNALVQGGLTATSLFVGGGGREKDALLAALGVGAQVGVLLPFSRTQEKEADTIGLELMARAGFDPREAVELWKNMANAGGGSPPEFLSTHPSDETRIAELSEKVPSVMPLYEKTVRSGRQASCDYARAA
jgi:predicted Zn-dependent protease